MDEELLASLHSKMETITTLSGKEIFHNSQYVKKIHENFQTIILQLETKTNDRMVTNHQLDQVTNRNTLFLTEAVGKQDWLELYFLFHEAEAYCKALHAHHFPRH